MPTMQPQSNTLTCCNRGKTRNAALAQTKDKSDESQCRKSIARSKLHVFIHPCDLRLQKPELVETAKHNDRNRTVPTVPTAL